MTGRKSWWKNMMSAPPERGAAVGEYPLQDGFGWTNRRDAENADLICPKEQPCDNVPATRPTVKSATTQPSTKEAQPTP
ncbi:hypothetical protein ACNKHT_07740 [Shigella flexneri]